MNEIFKAANSSGSRFKHHFNHNTVEIFEHDDDNDKVGAFIISKSFKFNLKRNIKFIHKG
jgi:hypothetical protein